MECPVLGFFRTTTHSADIGGAEVPGKGPLRNDLGGRATSVRVVTAVRPDGRPSSFYAGPNAKILAFFAGANCDPRRWDDPDRFDIRRDASGHLGYGTGARSCAGQMIARMEGEALFRALAATVEKRWDLAGQPRPRLSNTLRDLDALPVMVDVH